MKIGLVTDSTADLDRSYVLAEGITVVPSQILFNLRHYTDNGVSLRVDQILTGMASGAGTISTTPPTPTEYEQAYHNLLERVDHIISLHSSEQIAQNIVNARQAAKRFQNLVTVLDSRTIAVAQGLQVRRLAEGIERGLSLPQLLAEQQRAAQHTLSSFVVDDLRFLRMNGRISGAAAFVGNALNLKPILSIKNGAIQPTGRVMGHGRAIAALTDTAQQYQRTYGNINLGVTYTPGGEAAVNELRDSIARLSFHDMGNIPLGAAIAANAGPGVVGIVLEPA